MVTIFRKNAALLLVVFIAACGLDAKKQVQQQVESEKKSEISGLKITPSDWLVESRMVNRHKLRNEL